jgi:four helix bundle protein
MKHSAHAPYDEKMKNESYVCKYSLPMLHYSVERKTLMEKTSNKLVDLSIAFAVEILNLVKYLKEQRETIICNQIGRAGTSIGANIHEAQYAHGKADFVSKLQIALKEANETSYWLLLLSKTNIIPSVEYDRLETLCREIRITLIASINTTKQNLK